MGIRGIGNSVGTDSAIPKAVIDVPRHHKAELKHARFCTGHSTEEHISKHLEGVRVGSPVIVQGGYLGSLVKYLDMHDAIKVCEGIARCVGDISPNQGQIQRLQRIGNFGKANLLTRIVETQRHVS